MIDSNHWKTWRHRAENLFLKVFWRIQISIIENHHQWIINIVPLLQHAHTRPLKNRLFFPRLRSGNGRLLIQFGFWCPETLWFFSKRCTRDCGSKLTPNESPAWTCNLEPLPCLRCLLLWWPCEDAKMLVARLSGWHGVLASVGEFKASVWFFEEQCARRMPATKHLKLLVFGDTFSFFFRGSQRSLQSEI